MNDLINSGIRIFRINGAYFNFKEYEKLLKDLDEIFKNTNDSPTVIFDLKGPIPRISKVGIGKKTCIDVKKDQLIKILHENIKIEEPDIIHVDKKIAQCINIDDRILIDSSKCILKVISIERYKRRNSISKISGYKSSHRLANRCSELEYDENELLCCEEEDFLNNKYNVLPTIDEEKEERDSLFQVEDNLDFSVEERLIHKQNNMTIAYQNIINKHKNYNDLNKLNELSFEESLDSCKIIIYYFS